MVERKHLLPLSQAQSQAPKRLPCTKCGQDSVNVDEVDVVCVAVEDVDVVPVT